jgi:hypothetical protein
LSIFLEQGGDNVIDDDDDDDDGDGDGDDDSFVGWFERYNGMRERHYGNVLTEREREDLLLWSSKNCVFQARVKVRKKRIIDVGVCGFLFFSSGSVLCPFSPATK